MSSFKDNDGIEWQLELNVGIVQDIQDTNGVDLDLMMNDPEKFTKLLFAAPRKLVEMLYVVCKDQAEKLNIEPKTFGRKFDRPVLDLAVNALLEAIVRFYPRSAAGSGVGNRLPEMLRKMDQQIAKKTNEHFDKVLSDTATDLPVSSASTPLG